MHRPLALLAVAGALLVPAAAQAGPARFLSVKSAERAADRAAGAIAETWEDADGVYIEDYEIDGCERDGRRRADCEVIFYLDDGAECYDTLHVRAPRRGKLVVAADSDRGAERVFEDCTEPLDEDDLLDDEEFLDDEDEHLDEDEDFDF
jgi:hypothetical protein